MIHIFWYGVTTSLYVTLSNHFTQWKREPPYNKTMCQLMVEFQVRQWLDDDSSQFVCLSPLESLEERSWKRGNFSTEQPTLKAEH